MKPTGIKEVTLLDVDAQTPPPSADLMKPDEASVSMFERLAKDPSVDVDKLERLMQLHERTTARLAEERFNAAMALAQKAMRPIAADMENTQTHSRYASYEQLDRQLRPIYTEHGFGVSFDTADCPIQEHVRVVAYVTHEGGGSRTYKADMPADGKGAKGGDVMTKTHARGAAMSYGMRYLQKMIWNVAVGEDDRDGNDSKPDRPTPPDGFGKYWKQLADAAEKGTQALEAVWNCSLDEPWKSYRKYIAQYGQSEIDALKYKAKQVKR